MRATHRAALVAAGCGVAAPGVSAALERFVPQLRRSNYRGQPVSLAAGPALAAVVGVGSLLLPGTRSSRRAVALAACGAGAVGLYDDLARQSGAKGLRGHLAALAAGRVTTGTLKVVGLAATGLASGRVAGCGRRDAVVTGALVAGSANLVNLLDLRPGRALKVGMIAATALAPHSPGVAPVLGTAAGLLAGDVRERTMLGDTGANALGAALGLTLATAVGHRGRTGALAVVTALTLASEVRSFSEVIAATPALRWLDELGRSA